MGCLIVVDDVPVAAEKPQKGFVDCQGDIPDSGGDSGNGSPPSAQPASYWSPA